jgi:hypothetical protein
LQSGPCKDDIVGVVLVIDPTMPRTKKRVVSIIRKFFNQLKILAHTRYVHNRIDIFILVDSGRALTNNWKSLASNCGDRRNKGMPNF